MQKPCLNSRWTFGVAIGVFVVHVSLSYFVFAIIGDIAGTEIGKFISNQGNKEDTLKTEWETTKTHLKEKLNMWTPIGAVLSFPIGTAVSVTGKPISYTYVIEPLLTGEVDEKTAYQRLRIIGHAELLLNAMIVALFVFIVLKFIPRFLKNNQ